MTATNDSPGSSARAQRARAPLLLRWSRVRPAACVASGALIAASGLAFLGGPHDFCIFFTTMLGLNAVVVPLSVRAAERSLAAVRGIPADRLERLRGDLLRLPRRWIVTASLCGLAVHASIIALVRLWNEMQQADLAPVPWVLILGTVHAPLGGLAVGVILRQAQIFLRAGRELLAFVVWFVPAVAFHVDWQSDMSIAPQITLLLPLWTALATSQFTLPIWGVHERLRDQRRAEVGRVHAALRGERDALRDSIVARDADRLTAVDLLQYRAQVEALGTWPFGTAAVLRPGLYLFIPLASWVGGALVERVVDVVLG